jgi:anaerobic selenocysteine-containing dehydrogenase
MASMTNGVWKRSACILCECNCGLEIELGGEDGRHLIRLRGDRRHPSSRGYACEKAHRLDHYQNGRGRLETPLRRRSDGTFEPIDWDTAIREVAERLARIRDAHGGDTILYYGGGGQGNHFPAAYGTATRRVLGSRFRSSALAQEKTGEFWISHRMFGGMTRADFEHADVALFIGKNPWQSHSIPRARVTLKEIAADPSRTLIVIDPRHTETAELADIHLAVKPGMDAWLMAALLAILVEEDRLDRAFLDAHATGLEPVIAALRTIPIAAYSAQSGVDEALARKAARAIGGARALASFEDLGIQMNHHSTLVSYLHRLLIALTGSLGKRGSHYFPTVLVDIAGGESKRTRSPVVGAPIISGLVPCNLITEEILTDHPRRYRAMLVDAANPAHSLADSERMREAIAALDTVVVIDVAMTETARLAHYVLPAATQFEKAEATFFNFDFPNNYFHLRPRLFAPPAGVLTEPEIHARLVEALGALTDADLLPLREAWRRGPAEYVSAFVERVIADERLKHLAPVVLYRTLDLGEDVKEGAVVLGLALKAALEHPESLARAGFAGPPFDAALALFHAIIENPSGVVFAVDEWPEVVQRIRTPDRKLHLALDDMLAELSKLAQPWPQKDPAYPFVLSAGERRSFTANTIIRDPEWRKKDPAGALRMGFDDAARLGVTTGDLVKLTTKKRSVVVPVEVSDTMQRGHVSLPNGLGLDYPTDRGAVTTGVAPNELTAVEDRDPFVGTPWHKHVQARIERF